MALCWMTAICGLVNGLGAVKIVRKAILLAIRAQFLSHLLLDPGICTLEAFFESEAWFPIEHLAQAGIIRIATAYAHRSGDVPDRDLDPGYFGNDLCQFVDRHHPVRTKVERRRMVGTHQPVDSFQAVFDV